MPRQLRNRGGMSVKTIRQKYGIGSFVKERIRKLIPNELADIAVKAAPIVAPFNPLVGAAMRGIGRFDQRGSISDALKQAAATGALGIGVRKLGGAQDIVGLGSRGDRFTSPLSAERSEALSALFEGGEKAKNIKDADKGIKVIKTATEKTLGNIPIVRELPPLVQQQILVGGATAAASAVASFFKGEFREHDPETESFEEYLAQRKKVVGSQMRTYFDNYFKFDKDYSTMTDEEKDQFVARYNVAKGGRIGFQSGSKDNAAKINELVEKGMTMDEAIQKIAPGTKSSVEFTREELGLGPLKINQEIDKLLKEGVDIEIIKSMTGAPDELIQERIRFFKYGGAKVPLKKAKGGVMSIPIRKNSAGVKELDMRKSGGFVPIGVKEKADDVPAMLSLNEFVMTADAVRGAGDGNVKKGAQRMYDTMKKLESRVG
jgi:biotin operon repressor